MPKKIRLASLGSQNAFKHGFAHTPIGQAWYDMMRRCYNQKSKQFKDYGGRGIIVCERWHKIESFVADMGEPPKGYWLERCDNDGNYEPGNCRWATAKEQLRNTSRNRIVEYGNFRATVGEWAEELGINYTTLYRRIFARHWPIDLAFDPTPRQGIKLTYRKQQAIKTIAILIFAFWIFPAVAAEPKKTAPRKVTPRAITSCIPTYSSGCVLTFSWTDASTNEQGFRVHGKLNAGQYTVSATVPANTTSWVHSTIAQAATENVYCYQVSAYNTAGESARTPEVCYTVPPAPTIPAAPSNATLK